MRHCTWAYLAGLNLLLEELHWYVLPEVAVHIYNNGVYAAHSIEERCKIIVVRNLCSILLTLQAKFIAHELISESLPVDCRISNIVCIEITGRSTELCRDCTRFQGSQLSLEAIYKHHNLFTQTGRRCRLTVCTRQHWNLFPSLGILLEHCNHLLYQRIVHLLQRILDAARNRGVVYILWSKAEMYELLITVKATNLIKTLLDKVLYSLHIVVGYFLDILYATCIIGGKLLIYCTQTGKYRTVNTGKLRQRYLTQSDKILYLYKHTIFHKCILREIIGQWIGFSSVTAIYWRHRSKNIKFHNVFNWEDCFILWV